MQKEDWYFVIGAILAVLAFFGVDSKFVKAKWPALSGWMRPNIAMALIVLSLGLSAYGLYIRREAEPYRFRWTNSKDFVMKKIEYKKFVNEVVPLDGISYRYCTFQNVTFLYNAVSPLTMEYNQILGQSQFRTENPSVLATWAFVVGVGMPNNTQLIGPDGVPLNVEPPNTKKDRTLEPQLQ